MLQPQLKGFSCQKDPHALSDKTYGIATNSWSFIPVSIRKCSN